MVKDFFKLLLKSNALGCYLYKFLLFVRYNKFIAMEDDLLRLLSLKANDSAEVKGQENKFELDKFLKYVVKSVPYYSRLYGGFDFVELKDFPLADKSFIRSNFDDLISVDFKRKELVRLNTGGSTGEPFEFLSDKGAGFRDNAHHWYLYSLMGYKKGDVIVSCGGFELPQELRAKNIFYTKRFSGHVFGDIAFSALYLTDDNIKYYVDSLLKERPSVLRGYPSFFDRIAQYILENNLDVNFPVKGINLTAEMCSQDQLHRIEKAFNSMVYFEYGHSEVSVYCYTKDKTYQYESSPYYGYVEILDEQGKDVNVGDVGRVVVTGFNNRGMPFVRYDTGDLARLAYRNHGYVIFSEIFGRSQDFIYTKAMEKVYLTALIFGAHIKAFNNIVCWQIEQRIAGVIDFKIVKSADYSSIDEGEIISNFQKVSDFDLNFIYVNALDKTRSGKHVFLKQFVNG